MDIMKFVKENYFILVPVLWLVGFAIKNTGLMKDKYIPLILLILGAVLGVLMAYSGETQDHIYMSVIQGVLCAGGAILADQVPKQLKRVE